MRAANAFAVSPDSGRNQIASPPKVLAFVAAGRSCRLIGRELGLSKNAVAEIVKRAQAERSPANLKVPVMSA
jgi:hypothetical protein